MYTQYICVYWLVLLLLMLWSSENLDFSEKIKAKKWCWVL